MWSYLKGQQEFHAFPFEADIPMLKSSLSCVGNLQPSKSQSVALLTDLLTMNTFFFQVDILMLKSSSLSGVRNMWPYLKGQQELHAFPLEAGIPMWKSSLSCVGNLWPSKPHLLTMNTFFFFQVDILMLKSSSLSGVRNMWPSKYSSVAFHNFVKRLTENSHLHFSDWYSNPSSQNVTVCAC